MANLILKPSTGGVLKIQNDAGTVDALSVSTGGNLTAAGTLGVTGNTTLAGTANNLGTVTAGSIAGGSITSATTFPAGHVIKTHSLTYRITSYQGIELSTSFVPVTYASPGGAMSITGITATEGNLLHISGYGGTPFSDNDGSYATVIGYLIDSEEHNQHHSFNYDNDTTGKYGFWNGHIGMLYTVPANFTNKTISLACMKEGGSASHKMQATVSQAPVTLWMLVSEIQQ